MCNIDHPDVVHIGVRARTMAWNKECLINIGWRAPHMRNVNKILWIDADVEFRNPNWAVDSCNALDRFLVIQPWSTAEDLGPDGEPMRIKGQHIQVSFCRVWRERAAIDNWGGKAHEGVYDYPHPGYAWGALKNEVLIKTGGLIEGSGLGAGDHQMAMAFVNKVDSAIHGGTNVHYQMAIRGWAETAYRAVQGRIGYVKGKLEHQFHGAKSKRKYYERWQILIDHNFNPLTDLIINEWGVVELAGNKPMMEHAFHCYYEQRDEDANILTD